MFKNNFIVNIVPNKTNIEIFPYRKCSGVNWIFFMMAQNRNGILADEMGLGKTVQTVALFAFLRQFLVIAPSSVLSNWQRELALWCTFIMFIMTNVKHQLCFVRKFVPTQTYTKKKKKSFFFFFFFFFKIFSLNFFFFFFLIFFFFFGKKI
eukprot:GSMAST32.ASY1.ANO1.104.1 assembled CDS